VSARTVVVGGGIGGAAAALRLARAGHEVVLLERSDRLGGLVASFEVNGTALECFYHHVFPNERHILGLVDELGLGDRMGWFGSSVAVLAAGRVWPFTSPLDLLRFGPLPVRDRLRTGVGALRMGRVDDWEALDGVPARAWLERYTGRRALEVVWDPLLRAKFGAAAPQVPAAWMWGRFQQRAGGRQRGGEILGYMRGGFRQLFDALDGELRRLGVDVRTGAGVERIAVDAGAAVGVELAGGEAVEAGAVVFTGALPALVPLVPPDLVDPRWVEIGGLGVVCVVLELRRPLGTAYWTNVCDDELPFGGVIAHTNLVPAEDYGRHVAYLSRYFLPDAPAGTADPADTTDPAVTAAEWIGALAGAWPGFDPDDVLAVHPFRTGYAAPLVTVGHLGRIPPITSHVPGLYVATTAQIYPADRGMSEGVRLGTEAADAVVAGAERVAGGRR
jgi:protoporphyrinogen oxidase